MLISCAAPTMHQVERDAAPVPVPALGRFMREEVSVPFAFMMIETATARSERRMHKAATVLRAAAHDLVDWSDPPVASDEGREVFYAYAQHLEDHVVRLEEVAANRELEQLAHTVEDIRQTCNNCHRFFRPAALISPDVAYDGYAFELPSGVTP